MTFSEKSPYRGSSDTPQGAAYVIESGNPRFRLLGLNHVSYSIIVHVSRRMDLNIGVQAKMCKPVLHFL